MCAVNMARRCLFWCCIIKHKIHPLENIIEIREHVYKLQGGGGGGASSSGGGESEGPGMTRSTLQKMEGTGGSYESGSHRDQNEITPMHAAAVNGDKASLAKLLVANAKDVDTGDKFGRTPLMFCVLSDHIDCAELLIKAGTDINRKDSGGRTALHWAAHKGNFQCLKLLLSKGADWKMKDNEGQTGMHLSTRHKSAKCLALLMKQLEPGEVDDQDKNKRTALHWAASYGNLDHVKMLIKQDSNIRIPDVEGRLPLHWAASSQEDGSVDCVKLILESVPSVINWQDFEGMTALHLAVADGNEAVVLALTSLEKCNVSALDNMFRTPLHWGAVLGHTHICEILLDKKCDYTSSDSNGATPLHYAAQNNFAPTVEAFLKRKLKDEVDIEGRTAFLWAAGKKANQALKMFLTYNVDMHQTDKNGGSALHAAALAGHVETVQILLKNGAAINAHDLLKHTPLFRACEMGHTDVVQVLIDNGARVDVVDQDERSPLHWAALGGHAYICQSLIKFGIDPNVRDHLKRTPLQCAAYGGYVNCMSVLIENHADPNAQDNEGMTALHWACSKGHLDAVKLLIEFHAFPNNMEFTEDRYTPLDYALSGEHHEVAQYMIEQGALSITGIQDIAAGKIQATFRGYRVRKTFLERKRLMMIHQKLLKDAAKDFCKEFMIKGQPEKKAAEEYRHKEDVRNKQEVSQRLRQGASETPASGRSRSELNEKDVVLRQHADKQQLVCDERERVALHQRKHNAARIIQRAWRHHVFRHKGVMKTAAEAIREKRLQAGEEEWHKQIAALTIQLAWRKYYRRKLLASLGPKNKHILRMWDPEVVAAKQRALVHSIYTEHIDAPNWHPKLRPPARPTWFKYLPSAAAMSFNFAVDQYHPLNNGSVAGHPITYAEYLDMTAEDFGQIRLMDSFQPHHFSYNMYEY